MKIEVKREHFAAGVDPEYGYCPFKLALMMRFPSALNIQVGYEGIASEYAVGEDAMGQPITAIGPTVSETPAQLVVAMEAYDRGEDVSACVFDWQGHAFEVFDNPTLHGVLWQRVPFSHWGSWADLDGSYYWMDDVPLDSEVGRLVMPLMDQALLLTNQLVDAADTRGIVWDCIGEQARTWFFG